LCQSHGAKESLKTSKWHFFGSGMDYAPKGQVGKMMFNFKTK